MTGSRHTDAKRRERRALTVACALLVLCSSPAQALEPGDRAPAFSARALEGDASISLSQYRGKVVYLDFWASWCAPCAAALPALDALRKEFPQDQFRVLAVNVDSDPKLARQFLERRPVGYPSAADPEGTLPAQFEVETMPTSFLIDRQGVIRHVHRGFVRDDVDDLRRRIQKLVAERPIGHGVGPGSARGHAAQPRVLQQGGVAARWWRGRWGLRVQLSATEEGAFAS
jgi:peroxiredoxin